MSLEGAEDAAQCLPTETPDWGLWPGPCKTVAGQGLLQELVSLGFPGESGLREPSSCDVTGFQVKFSIVFHSFCS